MPQGYKVYEPLSLYFITSTVVHLIPVFRRDAYFRVLTDSMIHCIRHRGLRVHAFVIMPDHFHMIRSQVAGDLSGVIRDLKRFTSKELYAQLVRDHAYGPWLAAMRNAARGESEAKLWDDEFHPEQIYTQPFFQQKCDYIHANPVRAGYVDDPSAWKYSSACLYYEGREAVIPIEPLEW